MSSPANAGGSGQAPAQPAAPAANGQAPTSALTNNGGSPQSAAQNGQAPTAIDGGDALPSVHEWKRFQQELAEARRDAAKLTAERKALQDAQMSETDKLRRDYGEAQTRQLELTLENQRLRAQAVGFRLAAQLGIGDIALAMNTVSAEHGAELAFDEHTGEPTNLEKLLKQVLADHPVLAAAQSGQPTGGLPGQPSARPAANSGGATNPGAGARPGTLSREIIAAMSPGEYQARRGEILQWLATTGRQ